MRATNAYGKSRRKYPERDSIYFKLQGPTSQSLAEAAAVVKRVSDKYGATGFEYAKTEQEAEELWLDRKMGFYSGLSLLPGAKAIGTDVWCVLIICGKSGKVLIGLFDSVPVSRLPDLVASTKRDLQASGLTAPLIGHVGDGTRTISITTRRHG